MLSLFEMQSKVERDERLVEPQLDEFVQGFLEKISAFPMFSCLQYTEEKRVLHDKLKASLVTLVERSHQIETEAPLIYEKFIKGAYDNIIFTNPTLTEEIQILISKYNLQFVERLFTRCSSANVFEFWIETGRIKLPEKSLAIVVNQGNNLVVLRYLKEHGWFEKLDEADKSGLIKRAQRFPGKGLEFLKEELTSAVTSTKVLL